MAILVVDGQCILPLIDVVNQIQLIPDKGIEQEQFYRLGGNIVPEIAGFVIKPKTDTVVFQAEMTLAGKRNVEALIDVHQHKREMKVQFSAGDGFEISLQFRKSAITSHILNLERTPTAEFIGLAQPDLAIAVLENLIGVGTDFRQCVIKIIGDNQLPFITGDGTRQNTAKQAKAD